MKIRKSWIGSRKPATKGDLAELQEDIHVDMQELASKEDLKGFATKQDLKETEKRLSEGLMSKETGEELLGYMKSIDQKLTRQHDLPEEVEKLQSRVFKLELKR